MEEKERLLALEQLAADYYTLLHVIDPWYWQHAMTPFWNQQKDKVQARAEQLGIPMSGASEPQREV